MNIDLPILKWDRWEVVKAEIVEIAEWLPASFAVHRNPYDWETPRWCVSNIETGARCGSGKTRREAIENARARAKGISRSRFWRLVKKLSKSQPHAVNG
jgi:hypothetical protein